MELEPVYTGKSLAAIRELGSGAYRADPLAEHARAALKP